MCRRIVPAMVRTEPEPTPYSSSALERVLAQPRVRGEAQVVVRREVDDLPAVERRARRLLGVEDAQGAVEALLFQGLQLLAQVRQRIGTDRWRRHGPPPAQPVQRARESGPGDTANTRSWPNSATSCAPCDRSHALVAAPARPLYAPSWTMACVAPESTSARQANVRPIRHVPEQLGPQAVAQRELAAVAIDQSPPVLRRIVDVADLVGPRAQRELGQDRVGRQRARVAVDRRDLRPREDARLGGGVVRILPAGIHGDRRGVRLDEQAQPGGQDHRPAPAPAAARSRPRRTRPPLRGTASRACRSAREPAARRTPARASRRTRRGLRIQSSPPWPWPPGPATG